MKINLAEKYVRFGLIPRSVPDNPGLGDVVRPLVEGVVQTQVGALVGNEPIQATGRCNFGVALKTAKGLLFETRKLP